MIVIDRNAAVAIALGSLEGRAMADLIRPDETIIAPTLLCVELSHVMGKYVRRGDFDGKTAARRMDGVLSLVDEFADEQELYREAFNESLRLGHSSYDMFYFVLARRCGATLFTLDKKLADLCLENGVDCLYQTKL